MRKWEMGYLAFTITWISVVLLRTYVCLEPGNWAEWIGAIGTVLTLAGTIFLATNETRKRRRDELNRAYVVASRIAPQIDHVLEKLFSFKAELLFGAAGETVYPKTPVGMTLPHLPFPEFKITTEQLIDLAPLGDSCATRLANAIGLLELAEKKVTADVKAYKEDGALLTKAMGEAWRKALALPEDLFSVVGRQCQAAVTSHAPEPTAVELYGESD